MLYWSPEDISDPFFLSFPKGDYPKGDEEEIVYLGGLDEDLKQQIWRSLSQLPSGEEPAWQVKEPDNPNLRGTNPYNICNRGKTGKGVQLEITRKLRDSLRKEENRDKFERFIAALRNALPETPRE